MTRPYDDAADPTPSRDLPLLSKPVVRERADAARNREKVLAAAERLFAERGVGDVTMDDVAAAAGVGKGTLYRRFTDKAGLASALLGQRAEEMQRRMLSGPPPLGPGAPPAERLAAFAAAYLAFQERHVDLVLISETGPGVRLGKDVYVLYRAHCRLLLEEAGVPDPLLRAETLLGVLSAEQVRHWLRVERRALPDLADGLARLAHTLARP